MKKPIEQITKAVLGSALEEEVKGKSTLQREAYLDRVATKLLIDEDRETTVIACKYFHHYFV